MKKEVLLLLIFFLVLISISGCEEAICGDGKLHEGETSETCCLDAGCPTGKVCIDNECVTPPPTCEPCQYLENNVCRDYPCCLDIDCDDNNLNTTDTCISPYTNLAYCEHSSAHECINDTDCNDNNNLTKDICAPGTPSLCINMRITQCTSGDNFCPSNCDYNNDTDCVMTIEVVLGSGFVNRNEIGGNPLFAVSVWHYPNATVADDGSFTLNVSNEGAQAILVTDQEGTLRATSVSLPQKANNIIFDANSSAVFQIFLTPGIMAIEPTLAEERIEIIKSLSCFGNFSSFLRENLKTDNLNNLTENSTTYNDLLEQCVLEAESNIN